jgi:hypothetical protein
MTVADPEELRRHADEIVRRPEFRQEPPSLIERALEWFGEQLGNLLGPVAGSGGYALGYAILAVALGTVVYLLWRVFPRGRLLPERETFTVSSDTAVRRSRAEWLTEAERADEAGDWERAVHARYHAIAAGLVDEERVPAAPSTTTGERRTAFAAPPVDPARVATFDEATDTYEHVWFGGRPADQPDSRRLTEADRAIIHGAIIDGGES